MTYYFIEDLSLLAKRDDSGADFLYRDGEWKPDRDLAVSDRLIGYDPCEEDGSPYKIGNLSIMDMIGEITEEELRRRMRQNAGG